MSTHTKSTSGKTHRLTSGDKHVTLRYRETPAFDDRVQGDLWRKMQDEHHLVVRWPSSGMATVDPALDAIEHPPVSAEAVAERILASYMRTTPKGVSTKDLMVAAIAADRELNPRG